MVTITVKNTSDRTFTTPEGVILPLGSLEMSEEQAARHVALYPSDLHTVKSVVENFEKDQVKAEEPKADEESEAFDVVGEAPKKRGRPAKADAE